MPKAFDRARIRYRPLWNRDSHAWITQSPRCKEENPEGYAEYFANLPKQVAKRKVNAQIAAAKQGLKDAIEAVLIAEETGEDLLVAQEAAQVAALYVGKLEDSKKLSPMIALTSVGEATI